MITMEFICSSNNLDDYLLELDEIDFTNRVIQQKVKQLFANVQSELDKAKIAFEFVRDEIAHTWDIQSPTVTCKASEVLQHTEGICYAKSHLLAALLRAEGIPTGFCYQRLMLFDTPEKGYCIHALNAIYIQSLNKWIRLDARGNKRDINAQFSVTEEKLAFRINRTLSEIDYPMIYDKPHPKIIQVLKEHSDALTMYQFHLPNDL